MNVSCPIEILDAESVRSELKVPTTTAALLLVVSEATVSFVFHDGNLKRNCVILSNYYSLKMVVDPISC